MSANSRQKDGEDIIHSVFRIHIQDPGSGFFTPGSGIGKYQDPEPGFRELKNNFFDKILKLFDADADPGSENLFDPGSGIRDGKNSDKG